MSSVDEAISLSVNGKNMLGPGGVVLDFLPQFQDVVVDGPGGGEALVSPDLVEKGIPGDHFPLVGDQMLQYRHFQRSQIRLSLAAPCLEVNEVDFSVSERIALRKVLNISFFAAQVRLDPGQQFPDAERLGHVVVGADFKPQDFIHLFAFRREHENRCAGFILAQFPADFQTIHPSSQKDEWSEKDRQLTARDFQVLSPYPAC